MKELLAQAKELQEQITAHRRWLHAHAETGFALDNTRAYVHKVLEEAGLEVRPCGKCGLIAEVGRGDNCVLLRADMDALPMQEMANVPFASQNGAMHACGHDLHTAMLLGAARLLKTREANLPGTVRLMFQPAEELLTGARDMLDHGLLKEPRPAAAFMLHVLTGVDMPSGTAVVSSPGISAPAAATFRIRVQGKGCHGASPHMGVDPVSTGAHILLNLQQVQTREISMRESAALTIGSFRAGDTANVIPDEAVLQGSLRAFGDDTMGHLLRRTQEVAEQTAAMFGAAAELTVLSRCPTLLNDANVSRMADEALQALLGREHTLLSGALTGRDARAAGSEDFAAVSHEVPSVMIALSAGSAQDGHTHPAHHPMATFDEAALPVGAAAYAALALHALEQLA